MNNALKEGLMEKMKISEVREAPMDMKEPEMPSRRNVESLQHGLSEKQEEEAVRVHNDIRKAVSPGASNMKKMRYNKELAAASQVWADSCLEGHSLREAAGENIFASTGDVINVTQAIYSWDDEKWDYDYETNTCKEGKVCGHYTQAVWAQSDQVGCGSTNKCTDKWRTRIVCQYIAVGNVQGIKPYMTGAPCSDCKTCGYSCDNGMCIKSDVYSESCCQYNTFSDPKYHVQHGGL
ncbi:peptidase inhibitor 16-like [Ostrea edulis]|uniref:peptidase inhibitor 16-like n=1 Tax=Ostrea edulis TaxID=37623 RepID=UPI0024AF6E42|nr:peptidase inhibitor 16-like [Ostrea edulis]